ncbi:PadR family transcriptional regulator [bacterium]|nr:PadR family transcriptional regulator [bacterium]
MIELLILYELNKKVLTMYGISKEIHNEFSVLTTPSYGTIKPALNRLAKADCVKTQKTMSQGGRPSTYYSISGTGVDMMKELLLEQPLENPISFLPTARVKISCASVLNNKEQIELFNLLKLKSENISLDIKKLLDSGDLDYYKRMAFDNLICEYKNFISLLEGLIRASKN